MPSIEGPAAAGGHAPTPGTVIVSADRPPPQKSYDRIIIGGGVLGLACALFLRRLRPQDSLLIVEADGVPSEAGATHASPAIATEARLEPAERAKVAWVRAWLERWRASRPVGPIGGWVGLLDDANAAAATQVLPTDAYLATLSGPQRDALTRLVRLDRVPWVVRDQAGGYCQAEELALACGRRAVALGADLLLNTTARPAEVPAAEDGAGGGYRFVLDRMALNRTMARQVVRRDRVSASSVIVAAGAASGPLLEELTGRPQSLPLAYRQYPRLRRAPWLPLRDGRVDLPVIECAGFTLRPHADGVLVVPPALPPDPAGYRPTEGRLFGVQVGVRRELLDLFMSAVDALPLLGSDRLDLGKTVHQVRGAWQVLGPPQATRIAPGCVAVLGGEGTFELAVAAAREAAALATGSRVAWSAAPPEG